jgi:hypothetical protein
MSPGSVPSPVSGDFVMATKTKKVAKVTLESIAEQAQEAYEGNQGFQGILGHLSCAASCETPEDLLANLQQASKSLRALYLQVNRLERDAIALACSKKLSVEFTPAVGVGVTVKVRKYMNRRSPVVDSYVNDLGTVLFVLGDGGIFGADELEVVNT